MNTCFSFIVCTYRRAGELERCLASIVALPDADIEIVVNDNASPDNTGEVIERFAGDPRLRPKRQPENIGLQRNFVDAIGRASGSYLFILTDDDVLIPGAFPALRAFVDRHPEVALVLSPIVDVTGPGQPPLARRGPAATEPIYPPGARSAATIAPWAAVLSRLLIRADALDMRFFFEASNNAYFPCAVAARIALSAHSGYLNEDLVAHTVENVQHWDEFGRNWREIYFRTHRDYFLCLDLALDDAGIAARGTRILWRLRVVSDYASLAPKLGVPGFLRARGVGNGLGELNRGFGGAWTALLLAAAGLRTLLWLGTRVLHRQRGLSAP
jgi:glycosyltransferase involved in cell wall biosynthesis